jgi:hypothetical protein
VAKAIQAHGGDAKLRRSAFSIRVKGNVFEGDQIVAHSGSISAQGPYCSRIVVKTPRTEMLFVVNGEKGWVRHGDITRRMTEAELFSAKEDAYQDWVVSLVPLMRENFTMATLDQAQVRGRWAIGLRISQQGRRDIDLYFDRETWLLVKSSTMRRGSHEKDERWEVISEEFREFDGVRIATKSVIYRDMKRWLESEVIEARFVNELPPETFAEPR